MLLRVLPLCLCVLLFACADHAGRVEEKAVAAPHDGLIRDYRDLVPTLRASAAVVPPKPQGMELFAMYNREAPVPPQCYTRTEGKHNPCYVCHQDAVPGRENTMNDHDLQEAYSFSDEGMTNHWKNLFEDRSARVAAISDDDIRQWIAQDNYSALPQRLRDAQFKGWIPDLHDLQKGAAAFDASGFARDGSHWVAFNYKPMPSTFWPTNGATDDVMIRLPAAFRSDARGEYSRDVYRANLALLEANIKGFDVINTSPLDENRVGVDLDGDGRLAMATQVRRGEHYVGGASEVDIIAHVYPQGTEFLHTVRYLGVAGDGSIHPSTRMKEVRYMRRMIQSRHFQLAHWYQEEILEKAQGNMPHYLTLGERGLGTKMGWEIAGFIEDAKGNLRFNTFEENAFCMGCHNSIGSTIDKTFSFARKVDGADGWGYIDLKKMHDAPNMGETQGEIATYLERVGGGSEFRSNPEMAQRFYHADGSVNKDALAQAPSIYEILTPSVQRALQLNKAYRVIVEDQDYLFGRDPTVVPLHNVHHRIDNATAETLPPERQYRWDIRLDWRQPAATTQAQR